MPRLVVVLVFVTDGSGSTNPSCAPTMTATATTCTCRHKSSTKEHVVCIRIIFILVLWRGINVNVALRGVPVGDVWRWMMFWSVHISDRFCLLGYHWIRIQSSSTAHKFLFFSSSASFFHSRCFESTDEQNCDINRHSERGPHLPPRGIHFFTPSQWQTCWVVCCLHDDTRPSTVILWSDHSQHFSCSMMKLLKKETSPSNGNIPEVMGMKKKPKRVWHSTTT